MKKINVAIIGCGNIAGDYQLNNNLQVTHIQSYISIKGINIEAISDINSIKLQRFKKKWKIKHSYTDYKKMIKSHNIDIVSICTSNNNHYDIINYCHRHQVKKIFCEKPFCHNINQIKNIAKLISDDFIISINYFRRWNNELNSLKKYILNKKFGKITSVEFKYTKDLLNNGSHLLDYCLYLFGKPNSFKNVHTHSNKISFDFIFFYKDFNVNFINVPNVNYTFIEGSIFFKEYMINFNERFQNYNVYKKVSDYNYKGLNTLKMIKSVETNWSYSITNAIKQLVRAKNNKMVNHSLSDSLILREYYEKIINS